MAPTPPGTSTPGAGETGWPLVDACMRALARDGWLPFRMRAMVMAVASYHLWLDFRPVALVLARRFVDYEPGIHWAQAQIQAGTTGGQVFRMYNPVRQSEMQDPDGGFIRAMLPALARLPTPFIHAPWTAPHAVLTEAGITLGRDYPAPIAEPLAAARAARDRLARALRAAGGAGDTAMTDTPELIAATPRRWRGPAGTGQTRPRRRKTDPRQLGFDF
ncbi:FAD-binding domain-containing protein [Tistrella bauzanensis]